MILSRKTKAASTGPSTAENSSSSSWPRTPCTSTPQPPHLRRYFSIRQISQPEFTLLTPNKQKLSEAKKQHYANFLKAIPKANFADEVLKKSKFSSLEKCISAPHPLISLLAWKKPKPEPKPQNGTQKELKKNFIEPIRVNFNDEQKYKDKKYHRPKSSSSSARNRRSNGNNHKKSRNHYERTDRSKNYKSKKDRSRSRNNYKRNHD